MIDLSKKRAAGFFPDDRAGAAHFNAPSVGSCSAGSTEAAMDSAGERCRARIHQHLAREDVRAALRAQGIDLWRLRHAWPA